MSKCLQSFLIILFFSLLLNTLYSQTLNLNHFGIEDGLPQSGVQTLAQDKQGNIWIGTLGGVSKYNGLIFENFTKKNGLAENRIVSSCVDKNGNVWFGHWVGGLSKYDAKSKKIHEVFLPSNLQNDKTINCIFEDKDGNIWFGTKGFGILKYEPSKGELDGTSTEKEVGAYSVIQKKNGIGSDFVNAITQDKNGTIWLATDNGITQITYNQSGKKNQYGFSISTDLPTLSLTSLACDSKGNVWIGSSNSGIFRLTNGSFKNSKVYSTANGLASNYVKVIFQDNKDNIFIGTYGGGVSKYLPLLEANNYRGPVFQTISTKQGLSNDKVLAIIQDREQNIWIGTYLNLNQYYDEQFEIYGEQEGLVNSLIWSVIQDKKGNFWLGTEGGLIKYTPNLNPNQNSFINYTSNQRIKTANITALYEDILGNIWFSNFANGVSKLNPKTLQVTNFKDKVKADEVFAISGDKNGNVWIGTNKDGVYEFDITTQKFIHFTIKDGLGSNEVYTIFKDSKNNLWFGILGGDLTMYNGNTFKTYSEKDGYKNKFTVCITEDQQGNLWFGTYNGGIYKYNGKNFKNFTSKEGSNTDSPFLLICDTKNNLWIGTGHGIDKFNLKDETFKHYGKQDGFLGIEINPNAVCKDKEGNLWFGSIIGLVKYNSRREKNNLIEPITYLKKPRVYFKEKEIPENNVFSYNENHLTFDFVGASLTNPKRVQYQYMLDGLDHQWSPPTNDNYTTYPNLQPGSYTFKLKAANNDGIWNKEPVTFSFTISPPFWRTWWFYTLNSIGLCLIVWLYIKNRELKFTRQNKILENKVALRTQQLTIEKENVIRQNEEINVQKIELEKKNNHITDSIDSAKNIQDAILPPIEYIRTLLPDSFILYKPKDIVSGDFYWMHKSNNKILVAAVDCTGHGVPGAFMSLLGYNLLETVVKGNNLTQPAAILDKLNEEIIEVLRQNKGESAVKSGMDIALIAIDTTKNELEYAGAHNALFVVRNHELIEVKANKLPIGSSSEILTGSMFTNNSLKLNKNDTIYIFSDGFADQIGGPERKKFYYQPFKDLLISFKGLSMEQQKNQLEEVTTLWRGKREQTDDILIIGIRITN